MNATNAKARRMTLEAKTAAEMMTANPLSLRETASVAEGVRFLTNKGFSAAPVIDERGRPIGVFSRADILVFDRETYGADRPASYYCDPDIELAEEAGIRLPTRADETLVRDVMTPVVFSVGPRAPAAEVVEEMVRLRIHRIFVVDDVGTLIGVISALDVLRNLAS